MLKMLKMLKKYGCKERYFVISVKLENISLTVVAHGHNQNSGTFHSLDFIFSGIYHEPKCRSNVLDHGLLLVGYGYEGHESENRKYWLLKNRYKLLKLLDF